MGPPEPAGKTNLFTAPGEQFQLSMQGLIGQAQLRVENY
jgi:hypothetical protein